jgi:hypothetical protein
MPEFTNGLMSNRNGMEWNGMGNHLDGGKTFASRFCMLGVLYGS